MTTSASEPGVDVRTERLQVGAGEIRLLRAGSGPALLFLHAAGGGGWTPFLDGLSRHFDVLAPDHPGFDESEQTDEMEGVDDLVYHYLRLLDQLGHRAGGRRRRLARRLDRRGARGPLAAPGRQARPPEPRRPAHARRPARRPVHRAAGADRPDAVPRSGRRRGAVPGRAERRRHHADLPQQHGVRALRLAAVPQRPQARTAALPHHVADARRLARRRQGHPARARGAVRRAHRGRAPRGRRRIAATPCTARSPRRSPPRCSPSRTEGPDEVQLLPPHAVPVRCPRTSTSASPRRR